MAKNQLKTSILGFFFVLFIATVCAELCKKFEKPENPTCDRKFCPLERIVDGKANKCESNR